MFKTGNAQLVPNLLSKMQEEEPQFRTNRRPLLIDATNLRSRECIFIKQERCRGDSAGLQQMQKEDLSIGMRSEHQSQKQNQIRPNVNNLLINFDSEECIQQDEKYPAQEINQLKQSSMSKVFLKTIQNRRITSKTLINSQKNNFLLNLQPQQEELPSTQKEETPPKTVQPVQQQQQTNQQIPQEVPYCEQPISQLLKVPSKKQFLLKIQSEGQDQLSDKIDEVSIVASKELAYKRMVIRLGGLISRFGSNYYIEPIPQGVVFQILIRRDRSESQVKYNFFDCVTLSNFMTVIKDSKGYIVISKFEEKSASENIKKQTVIGRLASNFFGTEFHCSLQNTPYLKNQNYPLDTNAQKIISIEYQTNLFGMNGPRKMSAYIPRQKHSLIQNLNSIYSKENKKNSNLTVLKYSNKSPKWCKKVNAYVLNFRDRVTVPSIKNFIIVDQSEQSAASQKVVFGKFGGELFNLDIRYPFSVLQGVALAVSAFDRKLACQ